MSRKATGSVKWCDQGPGHSHGDRTFEGPHYSVRITCPADGSRPWIPLDPGPKSSVAEQSAQHKGEAWSEKARRLRLTAKDFKITTRAMRAEAEAAPDMKGWLKTWLDSRRARGNTSVRENESHWEHHIKDSVGGRHVREWKVDDIRALSRQLDTKVQGGEIKWKTALNIWATASKMCRDACSSKLDELRCRDDNPTRDVAGPDRGADVLKQYLYPSEFVRFVTCKLVPVRWRRCVALAVFLFPRADELRELNWSDVDVEHGIVHIHRTKNRETGAEKSTKTGHARRFAIEPNALVLLKTLKEATGGIGNVCEMPSERDMARGLRRWLWKANVRRAELHADTSTTKKITFHDLRATGLTWMAVRGDDALKIQQRAGHEDFQTTQGYIRTAEALRVGFGDVFPCLPEMTNADSESSRESSGTQNRRLTTQIYSGADGTRIGAKSDDRREIAEDSTEPLLHDDPINSLAKPAETGGAETSRTNEIRPLALPSDAKIIALARAIDGLLAAGLSEPARPLLRELLAHVLRPTDARASVEDDTVLSEDPSA